MSEIIGLERMESAISRLEALKQWSGSEVVTYNEIDIIKKYVEAKFGRVRDIQYYEEWRNNSIEGVTWSIGVANGMALHKNYFFGNVRIKVRYYGVVVLTNENNIEYYFRTDAKGILSSTLLTYLGVNNGLNLMGDGEYYGTKNIYQLGFNYMSHHIYGPGAATFTEDMAFNGYVFLVE